MTNCRFLVAACLWTLAVTDASAGFVYTPYDDFNDNSIDPAHWNVTGGVVETDGLMQIYMHRGDTFFGDDEPRTEISTAGKVGGEGILGFQLHSDRIPPRRTGPGDAEAAVGIADAAGNFLDINWLHDVNEFVIRAHGYYGTDDLFRWDPDDPGPATQPDGPLEIRDSGANSIQFFHNNSLIYTLAGKSVLPGTYFHAYGSSDRQGGENGDAVDFDYAITIDDLRFLSFQQDPVPEAPEPASMVLFATGAVCCGAYSLKRRRNGSTCCAGRAESVQLTDSVSL